VIAAFLAQPGNRLACAGVAAHLLVQHDVDAVGLEVGPDLAQKRARILALVQIRWIADARLARVQLLVVRALIRFAGRDITDLLKAERHGIVRPNVDRMPKDGVDRLGHVEIAHAAARDTGRARAGPRLVEHDDVGAGTAAAGLELHREMPRSGEAVDAGAHDDVARGGRKGVAHRIPI
jgi:hypothetical protein